MNTYFLPDRNFENKFELCTYNLRKIIKNYTIDFTLSCKVQTLWRPIFPTLKSV